MRDLPRAVVRMLLLCPLLASTGGCFTNQLWRGTGDTLADPFAYAVAPAQPDAGRPAPALLVAYHLPGDQSRRFYALVPLGDGPDHAAPAPFRYDGGPRELDRLDETIGEEQAAALRDVRFALLDRRAGEELGNGPGARRVLHLGRPDPAQRPRTTELGAFVLPYAFTCEGHAPPTRPSEPWDWHGHQVYAVVIPTKHPRPSGDLAAARFRAALLTPLALAADVVTAPLQWLLFTPASAFPRLPN